MQPMNSSKNKLNNKKKTGCILKTNTKHNTWNKHGWEKTIYVNIKWYFTTKYLQNNNIFIIINLFINNIFCI